MTRTNSTASGAMRLVVVMRLVVLVLAALLLAACAGSDEAVLAGYEREPEPTVGAISLPAANRDTDAFVFKAEPNKLLMVTFGFTSCPDICPTTLSDTRIAFNKIGDRSDDVDLAWVSIDPERDTADITKDYVEAFVSKGIALRTDDPQELAIAANAFDVTYIVEENDEGETEVAHTPSVFLVDDTGSIILTWPFGVTAGDIASDLTILLDRQLER